MLQANLPRKDKVVVALTFDGNKYQEISALRGKPLSEQCSFLSENIEKIYQLFRDDDSGKHLIITMLCESSFWSNHDDGKFSSAEKREIIALFSNLVRNKDLTLVLSIRVDSCGANNTEEATRNGCKLTDEKIAKLNNAYLAPSVMDFANMNFSDYSIELNRQGGRFFDFKEHRDNYNPDVEVHFSRNSVYYITGSSSDLNVEVNRQDKTIPFETNNYDVSLQPDPRSSHQVSFFKPATETKLFEVAGDTIAAQICADGCFSVGRRNLRRVAEGGLIKMPDLGVVFSDSIDINKGRNILPYLFATTTILVDSHCKTRAVIDDTWLL